MENYDNDQLLLYLHHVLRMAGTSSQYLSRQYNPKFEIILKGDNNKRGGNDPNSFYNQWSLEESSVILKEATLIGLNKGTEMLDKNFRQRLLENVEEYKLKPHVLKNYLTSII